MNELVTVIVPVFNAGKYLHRCLDSLVNQTYNNIEILLVNDGSTDDSYLIIDDYMKHDSRVKLLNQDNAGVSVARNNGIEHSKGVYCCFVDADDYVSDSYIFNLLSSMSKYSSDLCTFANYYENSLGKWSTKTVGQDGLLNQNEALINFFRKDGMKNGPVSKLYKKEILDKYNIRFDSRIRIAEDKLFNYLYLIHCSSVYFSAKPIYYYCYNSGSASNKKKIISGLYDQYLPFMTLDEIEKEMKNDIAVKKAYCSFAAQIVTRVVWKNDLLNVLSVEDVKVIKKRLKYYISHSNSEIFRTSKKNFAYGLLVLYLPIIAKLLSKKGI